MTMTADEWWRAVGPEGEFPIATRAAQAASGVVVLQLPGPLTTAESALQALLLGVDASRVTPPAADLAWMGRCAAIRDAMAALRPELGELAERCSRADLLDVGRCAEDILHCAGAGLPVVAVGSRAAVAALVAQRLSHTSAAHVALAFVGELPARELVEKRLAVPVLAELHFAASPEALEALTITTLRALAAPANPA